MQSSKKIDLDRMATDLQIPVEVLRSRLNSIPAIGGIPLFLCWPDTAEHYDNVKDQPTLIKILKGMTAEEVIWMCMFTYYPLLHRLGGFYQEADVTG